MGLLPRTATVSGSIRFHGRELVGAPEDELRRIRGSRISVVFQDPMSSLNPVLPVGYQIAEAVRAHSTASKSDAADRAVRLLEMMGVPQARARASSYPHEFSGGMRQRVVIAIAMANRPEIVIADEPTTALDVTVQAQILEALATARAETGAAIILITHDMGVVAGQADRVLVMYAGRPVEIGTVDDIFYEPRMPYTVGLIASLPRLDRSGRAHRLTPIQGAPPSPLDLPTGCSFAPRCPMAQPRCAREPRLAATDSPGHVAACHYSAELRGRDAADIYRRPEHDSDLCALSPSLTRRGP